MNFRALILLGLVAGAGAADTVPTMRVVPNSNTPLMQIVGSVQQIESNGIYAAVPTIVDTIHNYGIMGADEGASVLLPDGSVFSAFGDTIFTYPHATLGTPVFYGNFPDVSQDSYTILPANDWSRCHGIESIDHQLQAGVTHPVPDYSGCVAPTVLTNPSHTSTQPVARILDVNGLSWPENTLGFHTPTAAWMANGYIYLLYTVAHQWPNYFQDAVIARTTTAFPFNQNNPPVFTKLYTFTGAPPIPTGTVNVVTGSSAVTWASGETFDPTWITKLEYFDIAIGYGVNQPYRVSAVVDPTHLTLSTPYTGPSGTFVFNAVPQYANNIGKFMYAGAIVATADDVAARGWKPLLPPALQTAASITCLNGTSFGYRHGNLYAACVDNALIDGQTNWWYVVGFRGTKPIWTQNAEKFAVPLLTSWNHGGSVPGACIGEVDSKWIPLLNSMVVTYGSYYECGGLYVRTAPTPWGPFTQEQQFFDAFPNSGWGGKLIHAYASTNQVSANTPSVYQADGVTPFDFNSLWWMWGGVYGPYMTGQAYDNGDGTVSIIHMISGFRPYTPMLSKFSITKP